MSAWTIMLMLTVTLIWVAMIGAVAHLAAQKARQGEPGRAPS